MLAWFQISLEEFYEPTSKAGGGGAKPNKLAKPIKKLHKSTPTAAGDKGTTRNSNANTAAAPAAASAAAVPAVSILYLAVSTINAVLIGMSDTS